MSLDVDIPVVAHGQPLVERDGKPSKLGAQIVSAINLLTGRTGGIRAEYLPLKSKTVAQLEAMTPPGPAIGYCSNEAGGECLVYYAPAAGVWRRADTGATISD